MNEIMKLDCKTMAANLSHAARNNESVEIGGGIFCPDEMDNVAHVLESVPDLLESLEAMLFFARRGENNSSGPFRVAIINAASAIARARGEK